MRSQLNSVTGEGCVGSGPETTKSVVFNKCPIVAYSCSSGSVIANFNLVS